MLLIKKRVMYSHLGHFSKGCDKKSTQVRVTITADGVQMMKKNGGLPKIIGLNVSPDVMVALH